MLDKSGYGKKRKKGGEEGDKEGEGVYMSAVWKGGAIVEACTQNSSHAVGN